MRKLVGQDGDRDQLLLGVEQTPNPSLPTPSLRACLVFTRGRAQSLPQGAQSQHGSASLPLLSCQASALVQALHGLL